MTHEAQKLLSLSAWLSLDDLVARIASEHGLLEDQETALGEALEGTISEFLNTDKRTGS